MLIQKNEDFNYGGIKLFCGNSHPALAQQVADFLGIPVSPCELVKFPNENIFVKLGESVRGKDVFILQTSCPPVSDNILEMLIMIDAVRRGSAARITLIMPYMPYGRSDKKDQPRVPITARLMADLIQTSGANRYITVDLHAGQIQGFFSMPGDEITSFHLLSEYFLTKRHLLHNPTIVTADLGFAKKGRNFAAKLSMPMAFVEKRRTGNDASSEVMTIIGDVEDRDVVIVDDEISTAGSIKNTVGVVKAHGARDVYVTCTHPVFAGPAIERLRALPIKELVTTNTVPIPPANMLPNITVLSMAPLLGEVIMRVHDGRSVGELFNE